MAENERSSPKKPREPELNYRLAGKVSPTSSRLLHAWGQDTISIGETPFQPPVQRHMSLLSSARSVEQKANLVMQLQQTYGNRYVQRLMTSMTVQTTPIVEEVNDVQESEADYLAKRVTSMPEQAANHPASQRKPQEENNEIQTKPGLSSISPMRREYSDVKKKINEFNGWRNGQNQFIQRWGLEGPWNIGEPVHETLTEMALKAAGMIGIGATYTSKEAWEYTRGALWNDDPEGMLFDDWVWTNKYSNPVDFALAFGSKFKWAEYEANRGVKFGPKEVSLLKRSHFGDLQFLHGMAVKGEEAAKTRANMLMWGEFTYKVSTGVIPGEAELQNVSVSGIPQLFPALNKGTTVAMLFCIRENFLNLADVKKRAMGSLLHMIEDTYASSHAERVYESGGGIGNIKEFHSYTGQDTEKHKAKDSPSGYSKEEFYKRAKSAVQACADILKMSQSNKGWDVVKPELESILGLVEKPQVAGPGKEFETERK